MNKLYEIAAKLRSAIDNGFDEVEDNAIDESEALKKIDDLNKEGCYDRIRKESHRVVRKMQSSLY